MKISKEKIIILIICIISIAIIFGIVLLISNRTKDSTNNKSQSEVSSSAKTLYSHQLIDIENIETCPYETKKITDFKIASKYPKTKEAYFIDAKVDMYLDDNNTGKSIFIRDGYTKLNILQFKYEINNNEEYPEIMQLDQIIDNFRLRCISDIGIFDDPYAQNNSAIVDGIEVPISEKIYFYKELHSINYKAKENIALENETEIEDTYIENPVKNYDVNFYMDGDNVLICEFVRIL